MNIDYGNVSLKPINYIVGYDKFYRNTTFEHKLYIPKENKNIDGFGLPATRINIGNMICFGLDVPMQKDVLTFGIKIKTSILVKFGT